MPQFDSPDAISVNIDVTRDDLEASMQHRLVGSTAKKSVRQAFVMCLFVALLVGFMIFGMTTGWVRVVVVSIYGLFSASLLFILVKLGRSPAAKVVDQLIAGCGEKAVLGPDRITISSCGISGDHAHQTLTHAWPGVESIDEDEHGVSIKTGALTSYFVPRRAFGTIEELTKFVAAARKWRSEAANWHKNCPECGYDLRGAHREGCPECGWRREVSTTRSP